MPIKRIRVRLATSHPIAAYGGVQLSEAAVADVAAAVASGSIPMHFHHDITRPVRVSNVTAGTERLADGYLAAWSEFDVEEEVWAVFEAEVAAAGAPGGMSISVTEPIYHGPGEVSPSIVVAADAHHFSDEEIIVAAKRLTEIDPSVGGERLYQFASAPEAKVVFDVLLPLVMAVGANIAASVIYDAAKTFFAGRRSRLVLNVMFRETRRGTRKLQVHLEANNERELRSTLETLPDILESGAAGTFASSCGRPLESIEAAAEEESAAKGPGDTAAGDSAAEA